jgi:hypothetical protein
MIAFPNNREQAKPALPAWVDELLMAETRAVWEPVYGQPLTDDEVLEILLSVGRLIDALPEQSP